VARRLVNDGKRDHPGHLPTARIRPASDRRWSRYPVDHDCVHEQARRLREGAAAQADSDHSRNRARERIYEGPSSSTIAPRSMSSRHAGIGIAKLNASKVDHRHVRVAAVEGSADAELRPTDGNDWYLKRKAKKYRQFIVGRCSRPNSTTSRARRCSTARSSATASRASTQRRGRLRRARAGQRDPVRQARVSLRHAAPGRPHPAHGARLARRAVPDKHKRRDPRRPSQPSASTTTEDRTIGDLEDYVDTYEAWHLPTTPESGDGRTRSVLENAATLVFEEWHEPRFPWAHLRLFKPRKPASWGFGFIDQLASCSTASTASCATCSSTSPRPAAATSSSTSRTTSRRRCSPDGSRSSSSSRAAQPPTFQTPQPFNPAQLHMLEFFINQMFDLTGVSKANATSKSALGAGASGIALDTQYDIDSDRFRMPQANYARYRLNGGAVHTSTRPRASRASAQDGKGSKKRLRRVARGSRKTRSSARVQQGRAQGGPVQAPDRSRQLPARHPRRQARRRRAAREGRRHPAVDGADALRRAGPRAGEPHHARARSRTACARWTILLEEDGRCRRPSRSTTSTSSSRSSPRTTTSCKRRRRRSRCRTATTSTPASSPPRRKRRRKPARRSPVPWVPALPIRWRPQKALSPAACLLMPTGPVPQPAMIGAPGSPMPPAPMPTLPVQ
jgi:hypothetical protein